MCCLFILKTIETIFILNQISEIIVSIYLLIDIHFDDEIKALIILSSLLESWHTIVTIVINSFKSRKLKLNEI